MGLIFYENKSSSDYKKSNPISIWFLLTIIETDNFYPSKWVPTQQFVGTCIGLVYNIVPSINTDIKTLPNSYDLRQYRPYTSTNLVGTWGNITVIFALYQFQ